MTKRTQVPKTEEVKHRSRSAPPFGSAFLYMPSKVQAVRDDGAIPSPKEMAELKHISRRTRKKPPSAIPGNNNGAFNNNPNGAKGTRKCQRCRQRKTKVFKRQSNEADRGSVSLTRLIWISLARTALQQDRCATGIFLLDQGNSSRRQIHLVPPLQIRPLSFPPQGHTKCLKTGRRKIIGN
jgi:hypothetical protein